MRSSGNFLCLLVSCFTDRLWSAQHHRKTQPGGRSGWAVCLPYTFDPLLQLWQRKDTTANMSAPFMSSSSLCQFWRSQVLGLNFPSGSGWHLPGRGPREKPPGCSLGQPKTFLVLKPESRNAPNAGSLNSPLGEITRATRAVSTRSSFMEMAEGMKRWRPPQVTAALLKRNTGRDFLHTALMGPSQRESWENTYSTAGYRQEVNERTVTQAQIQHFSPHIKWGIFAACSHFVFLYFLFTADRL